MKKNIFLSRISMILIFILFVTSFQIGKIDLTKKVEALTFQKKFKNVELNKVWKIKFSKSLKPTIVNRNKVRVYDAHFNYIETIREYSDNDRTIVIKPENDYKPGSYYYIVIDRDLTAADGEEFGSEYKIEFLTKGGTNTSSLTVVLDPAQTFDTYVKGYGIVGKDLNLDIAKRVGNKLKAQGVNVIYTREGDNVSWSREEDMKKRADIANKADADYMVSIYANLSKKETSNGIETYYFEGKQKDEQFAEEIQNSIIKKTGANDRGIKTKSNFQLFEELKMTGVIVETGFLTNKTDASNLKKSSYKESIAQGISEIVLWKVKNSNSTKSVEKPPFKTLTPQEDNDTDIDIIKEGNGKKHNENEEKHVVTLNASRGGFDSGEVGDNGVIEKHLNLEIALEAGRILEARGIDVVYTRKSDFVKWDERNEIIERVKISDEAKSELMINIGANSYSNMEASGVETYYREGNKDGHKAARLIQDNIIQKTGATYRGIKGNTTYNTLRLSKAPSVWVAVGFLTNEEEEKKLKEKAYKDRIALGIANAVEEYFSGEHVELKDELHVKGITKRIKQGEKFELPKTIDVILDNNGEERVNIEWDEVKVNTSKAGVYKFEGTIEGREDRVALTLIVGKAEKTGYTVVIDPGHGGYDSGTIGYTKTREKNIALSVSMMIGDYLVRNGVNVEYTRTSDKVSWPSNEKGDLRERTKIANSFKSDLFVSIHLNSVDNETAHGIETYSFYGSNEGLILASYIQNELINYTGAYSRGVKQEGFYVIKYSDVPAVLVELGFISNKEEEARFKSFDEQKKYAKAVASGIFKKLGITNYDITD